MKLLSTKNNSPSKMKSKKTNFPKIFLLFGVIFSLGISTSYGNYYESGNEVNLNENVVTHNINSNKLVVSGPIGIGSNSEFSSFPGSGTLADPYIIENLNITNSENGIRIANTDAHFIIQNSYINLQGAFTDALHFDTVENGIVRNNTITNVGYNAIRTNSHTVGILFEENEIFNVGGGIALEGFRHIIRNNSIHDTQSIGIFGGGISIGGLGANLIEGNNIFNNAQLGILIEFGNSNVIQHNSIYNNNEGGIFVGGDLIPSNTMIKENKIWNQTTGSIYIASPRTSIIKNIIRGTGPLIVDADKTVVQQNHFYEISDSAVVVSGSYNEIQGNYISLSEGGIRLDGFTKSSTHNLVAHNIIEDNVEGIQLFESSINLIESNIVLSSNSFSLNLDERSSNNMVYNNTFVLNQNEGNQITDNGLNNDLKENYYDDYDGSLLYLIGGKASNSDTNPASNSKHLSWIDYNIDNDYENSVFANNIVSWDSVQEVSLLNVTYSLDMSVDKQLSWTQISSSTANSVNFDFTIYSPGTELIFRLQILDQYNFDEYKYITLYIDNEMIHRRNHTLSIPTIISPTSDVKLKGVINIGWEIVTDSFDHAIIYSVYYIHNTGDEAILIIDNIQTVLYQWDTTLVSDGEYLIKVVATDIYGDSVFYITSQPILIENDENNAFLLQPPMYTIFIGLFIIVFIKKKLKS